MHLKRILLPGKLCHDVVPKHVRKTFLPNWIQFIALQFSHLFHIIRYKICITDQTFRKGLQAPVYWITDSHICIHLLHGWLETCTGGKAYGVVNIEIATSGEIGLEDSDGLALSFCWIRRPSLPSFSYFIRLTVAATWNRCVFYWERLTYTAERKRLDRPKVETAEVGCVHFASSRGESLTYPGDFKQPEPPTRGRLPLNLTKTEALPKGEL